MKNIILGIVGVFLTMYTILIGLDIVTFQTQKNALEKHVSRIVQNTLEAEYQNGNEAMVKQILLQEIKSAVSSKEKNVEVEVKAIDLQKGLLSVKVVQRVEMLNGKEREIVVEKTAIVERAYIAAVWDVLPMECT